MAAPESPEETSIDSGQFETASFVQNRDLAEVTTADLDDATAQTLVSDLVESTVVVPVPETRALVHKPTGTAFESITQLAVFHCGWTAGRDGAAGGE